MQYVNFNLAILLARNTLWSDETSKTFEDFLEKAENPHVKKYIKSTFRKYLDQEYPAELTKRPQSKLPSWAKGKDDIYELHIKDTDKAKFMHYIDYLNTLPTNKDIRLSFSELEKKVKEWEHELSKQQLEEDTGEIEDGIKTIYLYKNGFHWVNIFGEDALKKEGKIMQHCVGGYWNAVSTGKTFIYSLRDHSNHPHVTIEINNKKILVQIQGKQNQAPVEEYMPYVKDFVSHKRVHFEKVYQPSLNRLGMHYYNKHLISFLDKEMLNVDDEFYFQGDLHITQNNIHKYKYLPKNMMIHGLEIDNVANPPLPSESLNAFYVIMRLPSGAKFTMPATMAVQDGFYIKADDTCKITPPENLKVTSFEFGKECGVTEIDEVFSVLPDCFTSMPKHLVVRASGSSGKLPFFIWKGQIMMRLSDEKWIPAEKGQTIQSMPDYASNLVTYLPDNFTIEMGSVDFDNLKVFPKNLQVDMIGLKGKKTLGEGFKARWVWCEDGSEITLPQSGTIEHLCVNPGGKAIFPPNYNRAYEIAIYDADTRLPKNLTANLLTIDTDFKEYKHKLPSGLRVDTLNIEKTIVKEIPMDMTVRYGIHLGKKKDIKNFDEARKHYLCFPSITMTFDNDNVREVCRLTLKERDEIRKARKETKETAPKPNVDEILNFLEKHQGN